MTNIKILLYLNRPLEGLFYLNDVCGADNRKVMKVYDCLMHRILRYSFRTNKDALKRKVTHHLRTGNAFITSTTDGAHHKCFWGCAINEKPCSVLLSFYDRDVYVLIWGLKFGQANMFGAWQICGDAVVARTDRMEEEEFNSFCDTQWILCLMLHWRLEYLSQLKYFNNWWFLYSYDLSFRRIQSSGFNRSLLTMLSD